MLPENQHKMFLLGFILIFMLQFEGISGKPIFLYKNPGEDATLSCDGASTCSSLLWLYNRKSSTTTVNVVERERVRQSSGQAARLSLNTNCSLVINNITAEDAGRYVCRDDTYNDQTQVHLSVLTISPSPPDTDPMMNRKVTLECSLMRFSEPCKLNSIRWVDETGTVLSGEGDGYEFLGQRNCISSLSVKRQTGHNRKYTCQFIDQRQIRIEAEYTPVFTADTGEDQPEKPDSDQPLSSIMLTLRIAGLILMIVITALLIRDRVNRKPPDNNDSVRRDRDEVSYENEEARPAPPTRH